MADVSSSLPRRWLSTDPSGKVIGEVVPSPTAPLIWMGRCRRCTWSRIDENAGVVLEATTAHLNREHDPRAHGDR